jgi:hypothetical protein
MLARHALDVFEQFALDLALGAGTDAMDRFDQQVDQIIGQRPCPQKHKCSQPGDA